VFAACQRLFSGFPLAVRRHYAEHRYGSMVLVSRVGGARARFSVLIMERDDLFVIRPWDRRDWARVEIWPGEPVPARIWELIRFSVPVPRDGALLGWVDGRQVLAILIGRGRLPEPWDDASAVPKIDLLPLLGSDGRRWGNVAFGTTGDERAGGLDERVLWVRAARGQVADLGALLGRRAGMAFWVPGAIAGYDGCVVVTERLGTPECWLPAGIYVDHRALGDGVSVPPARQLLAQPGATDLAFSAPALAGALLS
jgi:hypothetical protein